MLVDWGRWRDLLVLFLCISRERWPLPCKTFVSFACQKTLECQGCYDVAHMSIHVRVKVSRLIKDVLLL